MGYLKSLGTVIVYIGLFLAIITFLPGILPGVKFEEYSIIQAHELDSKVGPKNRLHGAQELYTDELKGAESFESYNGILYSGTYGSYVMRLEDDRAIPIAHLGEKCDGIWQEHKCGRILGLKADKKGNLYVSDAYHGIFKIDLATLKYNKIIDTSKPINGKIPYTSNSLDIAENGDIYWSHSSSDFELYDGFYTMLANPSGRLIRYNARDGRNEVLVKDLGFANGVKLSDDESFVIVAESITSRIIKYNLKGPKAGQQEIFIEGLPGVLDNLHSDGHGGFLASIIIYADSQHPQLFQSFIPHPYIRKMLVRLLTVIEAPFKLLQDVYPNIYVEKLLYTIGSFEMTPSLTDPVKKSLILRIDASGNVLEGLNADDETINGISSAYIHNNYLWLGSPWNTYIKRIPLKQAFPTLAGDEKQPSKNEKQLPKDTSDVKSERIKRDTESTKTKPVEPKVQSQKSASSTTAKPTAAPKTTNTPTTSNPTVAPTPKPSQPPSNTNKPSNTKSSEAKPTAKPMNDQIKKETVKTVNDAKPSKSNTPNMNSKKNDKLKEDATKPTTKSEKKVKIEQDDSPKEKIKPVETNRPKNANKK